MKLKSSGVRGVSWQPHVEQRTSLAAVPFRDSEPVAQGHAHPGHSPPDLSTATETDSEGPQSDLSPPQVEALSSQIEKHYSSSESGEDETPAQTEEPEISPELIEHDASRLAGGLQPSPLTGGHDDISPVTTMGAGASPPPSSSSRHSTGSHTDPEHLKSVLKDAHPRLSSLKRRTRRNSRVSFGRYVTVAEYSPSHRLSNNGRNNSSRNLTMQNFADKDMPLMGRDSTSLPQQGSGERGEGDHASELQGEGSDDVDVESSSSPPPPGELEPLGDEGETGGGGPQVEGDGELEEESADELEAEEPLEEIEQQKR